jgi:hypothetical protein
MHHPDPWIDIQLRMHYLGIIVVIFIPYFFLCFTQCCNKRLQCLLVVYPTNHAMIYIYILHKLNILEGIHYRKTLIFHSP